MGHLILTMNITENFQATQANNSLLEEKYASDALQKRLIASEQWQKRHALLCKISYLSRNLSKATIIIANTLINHCDNESFTYRKGMKDLMALTSYSRRKITYALKKLEQIGFLKSRQQIYKRSWGTNIITLQCSNDAVRTYECAHTSLIKREVSINTKNEFVHSKSEFTPKPNNLKLIELSLDWHPNRRTIDNIERILRFDYTRRESERRSFIIHTLKRGRKAFTNTELNALYYVFCRTTKHREQSFAARDKTFMPMELRRNLTEQRLYAEPINDIPAPDIPIENRICDAQVEALQNIFSARKPFKPPSNRSWEPQAYKELTRKPDDDFLDAEYQRQKLEGLI